jgi:hypothetical protein
MTDQAFTSSSPSTALPHIAIGPSAAKPAAPTLEQFPLIEALLRRRSHRFAKGSYLNGGPLEYRSKREAEPLTLDEEAVLAFAAGGMNGYAFGELPYQSGDWRNAGGGNMMIHFLGRTIASPDAAHLVTLFVINDDGVWMMKRPQDFATEEIPGLVEQAQRHQWTSLYEQTRVKIADERVDVPRDVPFIPPINKWSVNLPATTYMVPINEISGVAINLLLAALSEDYAYYIVDERNKYRSAGLSKFAKSRGGHLHDSPHDRRVFSISFLETWLSELAAIEQGSMLQNLGLATQALGLGGFPHFAAHPYGWYEALGFRIEQIPNSRLMGANRKLTEQLQAFGQDAPMPTAVGLERDGEILIKPFCPPYYKNMEEAVLAFVDYKYAAGTGTFRDGGVRAGWRDGKRIQAGIPRYSDRTIDAVIAYCEYVHRRYGRFPTANGPFRMVLAYQAHHIDPDFYDKFCREGSVNPLQRSREQESS